MHIPNWLKNPLIFLLVSFLAVLLAAFMGVMFSDGAAEMIGGYLGLINKSDASVPKNEILKFLGFGMGGVLLAIQAVMSYLRAKAMEDAANAQAGATKQQAKANENAEKGLRQERLKNAIEHLGNGSVSVRLGGAYELFHLAQDTESLRQTTLDILCAHIRRTTGEAEYREKHESKPSEEIQSLLTLLFVQEHEVFKGLHVNLQGSWLNGANLREAHLEGANLVGVRMQGARLMRAQLHIANIEGARMQGASFEDAQLQGADLRVAQLQETFFAFAHLEGACFWRAQLQGTVLASAYLQGAMLRRADLQGANLNGAHLQGADLSVADMQGAALLGAKLQGVNGSAGLWPFGRFVEHIRGAIGQQSDLRGVIFSGGLSQERVDSLVEGFSYEKAEILREKLAPHIDQPESHELPEGSGAITGAYTAEEAEKWITEYEAAMSKVPKEETDAGDE